MARFFILVIGRRRVFAYGNALTIILIFVTLRYITLKSEGEIKIKSRCPMVSHEEGEGVIKWYPQSNLWFRFVLFGSARAKNNPLEKEFSKINLAWIDINCLATGRRWLHVEMHLKYKMRNDELIVEIYN